MKTRWKDTLGVWAFGWTKIPLLGWVAPRIVEFSETQCVITIPLNWRTKNHLGAMYFGALAAGADAAGGLLAMRLIQKSGQRIQLVFQDFHAEFLKRAEGDVRFEFLDGAAVREFVERVAQSSERMSMPVHVVATVPSSDTPTEPVAKFRLTLSLKNRSRSAQKSR